LNHDLTLKTRWGVFSPRSIDDGTLLLMKYLKVSEVDNTVCRLFKLEYTLKAVVRLVNMYYYLASKMKWLPDMNQSLPLVFSRIRVLDL
jgi:hypothetical protein